MTSLKEHLLPEPCFRMAYDPAIVAVFGVLEIASLNVGLVMWIKVIAVTGNMLGQLLLAQSMSRNLDVVPVQMKLLDTSGLHMEGLKKPLSAELAFLIIFRGVLSRAGSWLDFRSSNSSIISQQSMISNERQVFLSLNFSSNLSAALLVNGPPRLSLSTVTQRNLAKNWELKNQFICLMYKSIDK